MVRARLTSFVWVDWFQLSVFAVAAWVRRWGFNSIDANATRCDSRLRALPSWVCPLLSSQGARTAG
jgi:hypothetical protein